MVLWNFKITVFGGKEGKRVRERERNETESR